MNVAETQLLWHNNATLEFLELYKNEPVLWDPSHVHHKNKIEVYDAWTRIQRQMSVELTVKDLKRKKESLMTSFRLHFRRRQMNKNWHVGWFAYDLMESFLGAVYSKNNIEEADHQYYNKSANSSPAALKRLRPIAPKIKQEINYNNPTTKIEMDDCELYGQLLATKLRRLDEHKRDIAMHEIDNIVFRLKMNSEVNSEQNYNVQRKSPVFIVAQKQNRYEEEHLDFEEDPI